MTYTTSPTSPAKYAENVTASDSVDFSGLARALRFGTSGDAVIVMSGGDTVTITNIQAGEIVPINAIRVNATGTTAGDIVALYK